MTKKYELKFIVNSKFAKSPFVEVVRGAVGFPLFYIRRPKWLPENKFNRIIEHINIVVSPEIFNELEKILREIKDESM